MTQQKKIVCFKYVEIINGEPYVFGTEIKKKKPFYTVPIDSTQLDIYFTDGVETSYTRKYKAEEIIRKLFAMLDNTNIVFFPLLHQN